jgi:hypothetical protein
MARHLLWASLQKEGDSMYRLMGLLVLLLLVPAASAHPPPEETQEEPWHENPARTRSILGHTALPLHKGEGFFGMQEIIFTSAGLGLSERVSLNVTTGMPGLDPLVGSPFNLLAGVKVATPLAEKLHGAVGFQSAVLVHNSSRFGTTLSLLPYGTLTYGTADAHVSATLQTVLVLLQSRHKHAILLPSVNGFVRVSRHIGFVGEAFFWLPVEGDSLTTAVPMIALRAFGEYWSMDAGVGVIPFGPPDHPSPPGITVLPVPILSFTGHWG